MTKRYHVEFTEDAGSFKSSAISDSCNGSLVSTTPRFDGDRDLALIDVADEDADRLEEMLDASEDVASYRVYHRAD